MSGKLGKKVLARLNKMKKEEKKTEHALPASPEPEPEPHPKDTYVTDLAKYAEELSYLIYCSHEEHVNSETELENARILCFNEDISIAEEKSEYVIGCIIKEYRRTFDDVYIKYFKLAAIAMEKKIGARVDLLINGFGMPFYLLPSLSPENLPLVKKMGRLWEKISVVIPLLETVAIEENILVMAIKGNFQRLVKLTRFTKTVTVKIVSRVAKLFNQRIELQATLNAFRCMRSYVYGYIKKYFYDEIIILKDIPGKIVVKHVFARFQTLCQIAYNIVKDVRKPVPNTHPDVDWETLKMDELYVAHGHFEGILHRMVNVSQIISWIEIYQFIHKNIEICPEWNTESKPVTGDFNLSFEVHHSHTVLMRELIKDICSAPLKDIKYVVGSKICISPLGEKIDAEKARREMLEIIARTKKEPELYETFFKLFKTIQIIERLILL